MHHSVSGFMPVDTRITAFAPNSTYRIHVDYSIHCALVCSFWLISVLDHNIVVYTLYVGKSVLCLCCMTNIGNVLAFQLHSFEDIDSVIASV